MAAPQKPNTYKVELRLISSYRLATPTKDANVKHEARGLIREGQHGRADGRKSNPRASASRQTPGWDVVEVYSDAGISGAKGRNGRPGLDSMLKDASRRKFDIVMAWAIDRLGRSLIDLLDTIQHLEACGVDLYLDQQAIDTTTPMGKLVFQVTGAFAEFERTMIRQRIKAGLKRAVAEGVKLGRPKIDSATERKVRKQLVKGVGMLKVAKSLGIGTGTVQRISKEIG